MEFVLDFVAANPVETLILVFGSLVAIGGVATYTSKRTQPSVSLEGPPRTAEEIARNDDTIRIPQSATYDVARAHDLTMQLTRMPAVDREPTVPVNVAEPKPWEWAT